MIRKLEKTDTEQVMQIWLGGNKDAHPFIPKEYWESKQSMVEEQLLQAEVFVCETDGVIQGFIGMMQDYIAGIFVDKKYRSRGIGKQLLDWAKKEYPALSLSVYKKNEKAMAFYRREGFFVLSEGTDEETGETEYTMEWKRESI